MRPERVSWIDVARGIGIIFVIYAHGLDGNSIRYFFFSFHMPLFFFLSGLVLHLRKNQSYLSSLKKDIKKIIVPYFVFALICLVIWIINLNAKDRTAENILNQVFGIFYGNGNNGYLIINIVLWFLPCLFLCKQVFWFIAKLKTKFIVVILFLFSIFGYLFSVFLPSVKLPFGMEIALNAIVFFGFGYLWHLLPNKINEAIWKKKILLFAIFSLITIVVATLSFNRYGLQVDIRLNRLNNYYFFYIASISGILATVFISKIINRNKILEFLGKYSMVLFAWHLVVFYYISKFLLLFISAQKIIELRNVYLAPIYSILAIIIILSIYFILNKIYFRKVKNITRI